MERRPLTDLPAAISEAGYDTPGYRDLYEKARSARIPAKRDPNGRWTWTPKDFDAIVDCLGLSAANAA